MPVFDSFLTKLQQVSLSDINHELGKAKESIVYESGSYLENLKQDAAHVGSLIRSESTKFGGLFGKKSGEGNALPKSTSLPALAGVNGASRRKSSTSSIEEREVGEKSKGKYKYKSGCLPPTSDPLLSPVDLAHQESIVNRFIKVVGGDDLKASEFKEDKCRQASTREDIRRKLADFGPEEDDEDETEAGADLGAAASAAGRTAKTKSVNNNLEVCFINETASDNEEAEDEDFCLNPLAEDSEEDEDINEDLSSFPRSKSDWESFRNPDVSVSVLEGEKEREEERKAKLKARAEKKRRKCETSARVALAQCSQVAKRQMILERQRRLEESKLRKIVGLDNTELNKDNLTNFNVATLQVILNDFREKVEKYNSELVELVIMKDELQNEQESMLMDIEDISHTHK